jgi:hypothetical protein
MVPDTSVHPFDAIGLIKCIFVNPKTGKKVSKTGTGTVIG